jgi:uncharacterized protein RhaS with RHS repeats
LVTGQLEFGQRWFSPPLMRWLTRDPIEIEGGDPNFYRAVGNNPTNVVDPSGLIGIDPSGTTFWVPQFVEGFKVEGFWNNFWNVVDRVDQFNAGFLHTVTFGGSSKLRSSLFGQVATRNHQGGFFVASQFAGMGYTFLTGYSVAGSLMTTGWRATTSYTIGRAYTVGST